MCVCRCVCVYIYIYIYTHILFYMFCIMIYHSSLCYTVAPCCVSILYMLTCIGAVVLNHYTLPMKDGVCVLLKVSSLMTSLTNRIQRKWHCVCVLIVQSCPTLCNPMDCSFPGSSVHGILQARILEWIAIPFSMESSQPWGWTWVSRIEGRFVTIWAPPGKPQKWYYMTTKARSQRLMLLLTC